jgi:hypothetical protein
MRFVIVSAKLVIIIGYGNKQVWKIKQGAYTMGSLQGLDYLNRRIKSLSGGTREWCILACTDKW